MWNKMTCANWKWIHQLEQYHKENNNILCSSYSFTEMEGLKGPAAEISRRYWEELGGTWKICPEDFFFYITDVDGKEKYFCVRHTSYDGDWNGAANTPTYY